MNDASIAPLPRVLDGVDGILRRHGPAPELRRVDPEALVAEVERAGLRGRGGAGFPTARKHGMALHQLVEIAGPREQIRAFLLGGYFGSWQSGRLERELHLSNRDLQGHGAAMGAGVVFVLGSSSCPVAETARVADWFADQAAGQCGPCERGLGAVSGTVRRLATGSASRGAYLDLRRWSEEIRGRGACHHPDGAVRFVLSALDTFADEFEDHAQHGACERCSDAVLPVGRSVPSLV